ncbi:putative integral membrane protein [Corynebacterium kutscheri]|uniref:Integral membrane protein n=1 Tax=Corynebacterium kutscheri TaxID=35755 RepID=A0A0F6R154_9CORY|nr:YbhN family protein [Corynebacterium kutscheri]AKE42117.1 hypothetical protein UL82_09900 [Corynebacterium kutscheri]VEH05947.1 putative integral membrane protein [Corynebacterium kutscheri]VEH10460.1 putative integral membrane protein [Corynebacterium kutscheri]VEH81836.1 putative integral membrane protein [Corynebacterium kutscheri]
MKFLQNKWVRFLSPLVVIVVAAFLLRDKMPFLSDGYQQVTQANPWLLLVAFLSIIASLVCMAEVMRLLLLAGGSPISLKKTMKLTFIANAWSTTFPGGAAISTVYQFHTLRTWGVNAVISSWFIVVSGSISTVWLIALGLIAIIFLGAKFSILPLLGSAIILIGLALLLLWASKNPTKLEKYLSPVVRTVSKFFRRDTAAAEKTLHTHLQQIGKVTLPASKFRIISLLSLLNWLFDIISVWLCIWAITGVAPGLERTHEIPSILGITLAFVTAKIVGTANVTPAGLGPVEAAMTASLVAVGMTATNAFGAVFIYRIISFALITALGWAIYFYTVTRGGVRVIVNTEATTDTTASASSS